MVKTDNNMIRKLESTPNDDLSAPKRESKSPGWMKTQLITQDRIQIWVRPLDGVWNCVTPRLA